MELEIRPEPDVDEREAIATALARAGVDAPRPDGYDSLWRAAGLREATGADGDESDP